MATPVRGAGRRAPRPASACAPVQPLPRYARLVLISDFFMPLDELRERLRGFVAMGVRGHLLQVLDPAEPEPAVRRPGPLRGHGAATAAR